MATAAVSPPVPAIHRRPPRVCSAFRRPNATGSSGHSMASSRCSTFPGFSVPDSELIWRTEPVSHRLRRGPRGSSAATRPMSSTSAPSTASRSIPRTRAERPSGRPIRCSSTRAARTRTASARFAHRHRRHNGVLPERRLPRALVRLQQPDVHPSTGKTRLYLTVAVRKAEPDAEAYLEEMLELERRVVSEDEAILQTIRFHPGTLTAADRTLARSSTTCSAIRGPTRRATSSVDRQRARRHVSREAHHEDRYADRLARLAAPLPDWQTRCTRRREARDDDRSRRSSSLRASATEGISRTCPTALGVRRIDDRGAAHRPHRRCDRGDARRTHDQRPGCRHQHHHRARHRHEPQPAGFDRYVVDGVVLPDSDALPGRSLGRRAHRDAQGAAGRALRPQRDRRRHQPDDARADEQLEGDVKVGYSESARPRTSSARSAGRSAATACSVG